MRTHITCLMLTLTVVAMVYGCNTEKRAIKHIHKAVRISQPTVNKYFADTYNITDSVNTKIIYKPGETIRDTVTEIEIEVINDTVYKTEFKKIFIKQTDTIDRSLFERKQDGAKLAVLNDKIGELTQSLNNSEKARTVAENDAKRRKKNNTILGGIIIGYVLLKFLFIWLKKQFPVSKVVGVAQKIF